MLKEKTVVTFFLMIIFAASKAQGDITLYSMRELNQSSYLNPAFISKYDMSVGIPALSNTVAFQIGGFGLGNITTNIQPDGYFNFTNFYSDINSNLVGIKQFTQTEFFHFRKQFGHYQIGFNSALKINLAILFSKDFFGFVAKGNQFYAGQDVSFAGTAFQINSYIETGISVAREFEKFTVGARLKMLNGIANASTSSVDVHYHTASNSFDSTTVSLSGTLNTSGIPSLQNQGNSFSPSDIKPFDNLGWAMDLGATYNVTPRLLVAASAIDIGFINWKNLPYNYVLNNVNVVFPGFSYLQAKDSAVRQQYLDSLKGLVKSTSSKNAYSTVLPSRFIISGDYDLTLRDKVGLMFQVQYFYGTFIPAYSINYSRQIGTNWKVITNYSYYNSSFSNFGLGTSIKCGAFQIYAMQDDILYWFAPSATRTIYLRFGCNLVWGEQRPRPRF